MCTIGHWSVFSLIPWSGQIHAGFHVSRITWDTARPLWNFIYGTITLFGAAFQPLLLSLCVPHRGPATPPTLACRRFRLFPVRSPLLRESMSFSFPRVTKMFQFSRFRLQHLCIQCRITRYYSGWVAPFGHPRIKACLRLPGAYRSLPRPSSPINAKSSTMSP